MRGKVLLGLFLILGVLAGSALAIEIDPRLDALPAGFVNVILPEFGDRIGGGDYGLANYIPVETVGAGTPKQEIRMVRSPLLYLGQRRRANFQVILGDIGEIYFWIETPPVAARWRYSIDIIYPDGHRANVRGGDLKPGARQWTPCTPGSRLEVSVGQPDTTFKYANKFVFTICPTVYSVFPDYQPMPYRTYWD